MFWVVCHYSEIGLKGKNRKFFEEKLIENIKKALPEDSFKKVRRISGRILIELKESFQKEKIKKALKNVFGISYFAFAIDCQQKIDAIKKKALELLKSEKFRTFKIETQRSKKDFPLTSQEINEKVGEYVLNNLKSQNSNLKSKYHQKTKIKVNLKKPEVICFIEIVEKYAFLYLEKIKGPGGLPLGVSGKAVSLLSGGIDSPVASFYTMKRGVKLIFVHFTSYPFTSQNSLEKVRKIIKVLNKFQFRSKLYLVPFTKIQKEILLKTKAKLRVVLYRRFMFKIAELIAKKEKAKAIVTGESIGQVASQTLENILVIEEGIKFSVLRPLIGFDKEKIIQKAKEIGTFSISILPGEDCCARFLPKHPETKANLQEVKKEEKKLEKEKLIKEAIEESKIEFI